MEEELTATTEQLDALREEAEGLRQERDSLAGERDSLAEEAQGLAGRVQELEEQVASHKAHLKAASRGGRGGGGAARKLEVAMADLASAHAAQETAEALCRCIPLLLPVQLT